MPMKRLGKFVLALWVLMGLSLASAQNEDKQKATYGWQKEMVGNLNFTQNSFDNWVAGGEDSWSWQLDVNAKFVNDQKSYNWSNTGKLSFGKTKVGDDDSRKAADEIKLESVYTYKMAIYVNPFISATGQTQLTQGYNYTDTSKISISNFMDPAYFTQSVGLGYAPTESFKTRLGAAIKETKTSEYENLYGEGEELRVEYGVESVTDVNMKLNKLILYNTKLELFSNLQRLDEIDVNWDNVFSAKLAQYITVSLNIKLFYDKNISAKRQLKQTLAVGLSYTFI
ncbi:MAG: DUF3078 domain-containing protein [Caldithrix sp.]|nr:DUF3078 domain-containing protein [Caldithrix sp.]